MPDLAIASRKHRERLLADPHRPAYHLATLDDSAHPGDPNGAFFADGLYHLMYLYRNFEQGEHIYHWAHLTSRDLLHWRYHRDALTGFEGDKGCFSGGAFLDDDGTAYLTFWKFASPDPEKDRSGIGIAYAKPPYEHWERIEPIPVNATEWGIQDITVNGEVVHLGCADPSNIWKMNGYYYMQLGNLCVLNNWGREADSPDFYRGGWTELFRSKDLKNWEFVHRFYENTFTGDNDWPDATEDDMCPSFLPLYDAKSGGKLTDKWLQLFISHNKGCQYLVGTLENEKFHPEVHGRMSWVDRTYFAPEALIDSKNRQLVWVWLLDSLDSDFETFGWSGVYCFPRNVWWENNALHMAPAEELDLLQYHHQSFTRLDSCSVPVRNGQLFRLKSTWKSSLHERAGFRVRVNAAKQEYTEIYYDPEAGQLVMDTTNSGSIGWIAKETAPFQLKEGEPLQLDIFVDKSVIEVYANERQAICRRVFLPYAANALGVSVIGDLEKLKTLDAWEMAPTNIY